MSFDPLSQPFGNFLSVVVLIILALNVLLGVFFMWWNGRRGEEAGNVQRDYAEALAQPWASADANSGPDTAALLVSVSDSRVDTTKSRMHCTTFLLSVVSLGCSLAALYCTGSFTIAHDSPDDGCKSWAPWVALAMFAIYIIEGLIFSHTHKFLDNLHNTESVANFIGRVAQFKPYIWFWCECYHYETHLKSVVYTDSDGNTQTRMDNVTEKVISFTTQQEFRYTICRDASRPFPVLFQNVAKVHCRKELAWADANSKAHFEHTYSTFVETHRSRDVHFDFKWDWKMPEFEEHLLAFVDVTKRPCFMSMGWYFLSVLLLFSWPYRLWMEGECVRVTFTFVKELYIDLSEQTPHVDLSPVQVPTPLSQVQVNPDTITSNADSNKHVTELL